MATSLTTIDLPVGIRNGITMLPNTPKDLRAVVDLLDRIYSANGGAKDIPGEWETDRDLLIAEVTSFIGAFQEINSPMSVDGAIDPHGNTLRRMNALAEEPPLRAVAVDAPGGRAEAMTETITVAATASMPGFKPMQKASPTATYTRKLIRVDSCSIKWFGVVVPDYAGPSAKPHIFFTPTPIQGGYADPGYNSFGSWGQLWDDYTSRIGAQMTAAHAYQILVIPFYKNSQASNLGDFSQNWHDVIAAVITAAFDSLDVMLLRDSYTFDRIVSSSFSNGWVAHSRFNASPGAADASDAVIDLDGAAAQPVSSFGWRPRGSVKILNRGSPVPNTNPVGTDYYVGGRWQEIDKIYAPADRQFTHHMCSAHLLTPMLERHTRETFD